jgi:glycosyltransferase involved in cell wall biosynthesis
MGSISVVVCTLNPRTEYLERVFGALDRQSLSKDRWELIVVDSASDRPIADRYDLSWHPASRHVREETSGLASARFRGIAESSGGLIVFVDDDNLLAPEFLAEALAIADRFPQLGVFGAGVLAPEFESRPPDEIRPFLSLLAIRNVRSPRVSDRAYESSGIPWGAGLCVVRSVATRYRSFVERLNVGDRIGRTPQDLFSGDDDLFSWLAVSRGLAFGIFPQLRLTHLIASHRLTQGYILRLIGDHAFSSAVRDYVLTGSRPVPLRWSAPIGLFFHGLRRGRFANRCRQAELSGVSRAARFVVEQELQPLAADGRRLAAV